MVGPEIDHGGGSPSTLAAVFCRASLTGCREPCSGRYALTRPRNVGERNGEMTSRVTARTSDIEKAAGVLRAGDLMALPAETVYGLGANAEDPAAVSRIFQVKGCPPSHPLIVHIGGAQHLDDWVQDAPATARLLAEHFRPGPLTLVRRTHSPSATGGSAGEDRPQRSNGSPRSRSHVFALTMPSAFNPWLLWSRFTADSVPAPK